jgi:uncharacterized protein YjbI with pentapeptide repeats
MWTNLSRTNLNRANLSWTNLRVANLNSADLRWANLNSADLRWANLSKTKYNDATEWPRDFEPEEFGAVKLEV